MTLDALTDRILIAHDRLAALRPAVEAGAPWPRSEHFGAEPEASWMPPELLAHLGEMLPYWLGQVERILEGHPEPVSFGRVQTDDDRIAAIGRDRDLAVPVLFDRIESGVDKVATRLRALEPAAADRRGTHPTLGEMRVDGIVERMLAGHFDEHVTQPEGILAGVAGDR